MKQLVTVGDILSQSAEIYAGRTAFLLEDGTKEISYGDFGADAAALAAALKEKLKLEGRHIGIMAKNSYYWCVAYFAAVRVGVAVPLDRESRGEAVADFIDFGDVSAVICDSVCARELKRCAVSCTLICTDADEEGELESIEGLIGYGKAHGSNKAFRDRKNPDEMAVLLFTSGTTGKSKGVMLSHTNILSDLAAVEERVKITGDDRSLSVLPLHHTYEAITMLMMISKGATVCFSSSYKNLIRDFSVYRPTVLVCVPLLLQKLYKRIEKEMHRSGRYGRSKLASLVSGVVGEEGRRKLFSPVHESFGGRLKKIIVGAAPIEKKTAEGFEDFGFAVIIGYGLTECSPIVICNGDTDRKTDSVGKPLKGVSIKLLERDAEGIGEIAVKGPMVMKGYYKNKGATDAVLCDGWLHTGDLGYADSEGYYYITGRSKNIIVTPGGKNIYPEEIEMQLLKSPLVSECIVFSGKNGEVNAEFFPDYAELRSKSGKESLTESDAENYMNAVIRTVNRRLPPYKRIKSFTLREEPFEKTSTRKIKR